MLKYILLFSVICMAAYNPSFPNLKVRDSVQVDSLKGGIPLKAGANGKLIKCVHLRDTTYTLVGSDTVSAGTGITVSHIPGSFQVALYQLPTISVLTNNHAVNYVGQTLTAVTVSWTLTGATITSQALTDAGSLPIGDRSHAFTGLSLTTDKTYTLTIDTGSTVVGTASTYCLFYIQKFYGTSANAAPTAGDVQAGTSQWVTQSSASRVLSSTAIAGGGNYIFYAYPSAWGTVNIYANGFLETWNITTISLTNSYGDVRNYYVFTSPFPIVGTPNIEARIP